MLVEPGREFGVLQRAVNGLHETIPIFRTMRKKSVMGASWQRVDSPITDHSNGSLFREPERWDRQRRDGVARDCGDQIFPNGRWIGEDLILDLHGTAFGHAFTRQPNLTTSRSRLSASDRIGERRQECRGRFRGVPSRIRRLGSPNQLLPAQTTYCFAVNILRGCQSAYQGSFAKRNRSRSPATEWQENNVGNDCQS